MAILLLVLDFLLEVLADRGKQTFLRIIENVVFFAAQLTIGSEAKPLLKFLD